MTHQGIYYINAGSSSNNKPNTGKQVLLVFSYAASSSVLVYYQVSLGYYIKARRKYNTNAWTSWADIATVA
jgi:hypothetical protein